LAQFNGVKAHLPDAMIEMKNRVCHLTDPVFYIERKIKKRTAPVRTQKPVDKKK
jgi:hypothetical protein